jgi:hypothetical protein
LIDKDAHILEIFAARRGRLRSRHRLGDHGGKKLDFFLVEVAEAFADLWESTRDLNAWDEQNIVDIGVLTTKWGKCRPIPVSYKTSAVSEARNSEGLAGTSVKDLVLGLSRAGRKPIRMRLGRRHRKNKTAHMAARLEIRTAKSQSAAAHPEARSFGQRVQSWERLHYFRKGQALAAKQHRLSLAMDASDVSYKKIMNATMCLPQANVVMWMPPLDLGGPKGLCLRGSLRFPGPPPFPSGPMAFHSFGLPDLLSPCVPPWPSWPL